MLALVALLLQSGPAAPDIQLDVKLRAKSVTIERKGVAKLEVRGAEGSVVRVEVEPKAEGRRTLRNVTVDIHAEASVGEGAKVEAKAETGAPR